MKLANCLYLYTADDQRAQARVSVCVSRRITFIVIPVRRMQDARAANAEHDEMYRYTTIPCMDEMVTVKFKLANTIGGSSGARNRHKKNERNLSSILLSSYIRLPLVYRPQRVRTQVGYRARSLICVLVVRTIPEYVMLGQ